MMHDTLLVLLITINMLMVTTSKPSLVFASIAINGLTLMWMIFTISGVIQ